mmetsp:Transcript_6540/g.14135  ORF Transcript_6540/g.14135 Transcript_6540/m.14135 type:complete len:117 (+) Transcript_6540:114-464(+)
MPDDNRNTTKKRKKTEGSPISGPLEIAPSVDDGKKAKREQASQQKIIVLLDRARLETAKTRKGAFELLNCDDHHDLCKKNKKKSGRLPSRHMPSGTFGTHGLSPKQGRTSQGLHPN